MAISRDPKRFWNPSLVEILLQVMDTRKKCLYALFNTISEHYTTLREMPRASQISPGPVLQRFIPSERVSLEAQNDVMY